MYALDDFMGEAPLLPQDVDRIIAAKLEPVKEGLKDVELSLDQAAESMSKDDLIAIIVEAKGITQVTLALLSEEE